MQNYNFGSSYSDAKLCAELSKQKNSDIDQDTLIKQT